MKVRAVDPWTMRQDPPPPHKPYRRPSGDDGWEGSSRRRRGSHLKTGSKMGVARRWPRRVLISANVVAALMILGAAGGYGYVTWRLNQINKVKVPHLLAAGGNLAPFTLLLVGSDSRAALGAEGVDYGGSSVSGARSDTTLLMRVVPKYHELMMMSIPRDLWVNIPGQGPNRINSAFNNGPDLLVQTIEQDLDIPINHYIDVNFNTFQAITDAVGGVKFYFPTPAKDTLSDLSIPAAGCYNLTGAQALAFVRSRHYEYYQNGQWNYEAESDLARIQRQQAFIKKMVKKAESQFTNPLALNGIVSGVVKNLTVDSGMSSSLLLELAQDFHSIDASSIPSITLPNYAFTTSGGADVLGLQQPQASQAIAAFKAYGTTPPPAPPKAPSKSKSKSSSTTRPTLPPVTIAPHTLSVEVDNGTGVSGQAGQLSQTLSALGYNTTVQLASPGTYSTTQIDYAPDSLTAAQQLAAQIPGGGTLVEDSALTPTPYNVEVVTGSNYTTAAGGSTSSTTASTSTTSTTIPGTNAGVYELPGSTGPPPANC